MVQAVIEILNLFGKILFKEIKIQFIKQLYRKKLSSQKSLNYCSYRYSNFGGGIIV